MHRSVILDQQVSRNKWIKFVVHHLIWLQRFGAETDILEQT